MFCKKCGCVLPENAQFCPRCGATLNLSDAEQPYAPTAPAEPQPYAPVQPAEPVQPAAPSVTPVNAVPFVTEQQKQEANGILIWGIVGLAFSCSFFLSFLGIIFSAVARSKVKAYIDRYGVIYGKAKVGNILSKVGLPLGIGMTILCIIYIVFYVFLIIGLVNGVFTNY